MRGANLTMERVRAWNPRARSAGTARTTLLLAVLAGAALATACGSDEPAITVAVETPSPTPSATSTPTPTPAPPLPWPAEPIEPGPLAAELSNPMSEGFAPPPPQENVPVVGNLGVVRMVAPSLDIDHYITPLHVVDGKMGEPHPDEGSYAVGWYPSDENWEFGEPGEAGNSVFSAHETWNHMQGPFYNLHRAHIGDDIYLVMEDGERRHYQVASVTRYPVESIPMNQVLWPKDRPKEEEWITLYTCGGDIVYDQRGYGTYFDRDVLVAKWVGSEPPPREPLAERR